MPRRPYERAEDGSSVTIVSEWVVRLEYHIMTTLSSQGFACGVREGYRGYITKGMAEEGDCGGWKLGADFGDSVGLYSRRQAGRGELSFPT